MARPVIPPTDEQRAVIDAIAAQPVSVRDACRRLDVSARLARRWLEDVGLIDAILRASAPKRQPKPEPKRRPKTLAERLARKRAAKQAYEAQNRDQILRRKADSERARRQRIRAEGAKAEPPEPKPVRPPEPPRDPLIDVAGFRPEFPPGPTMIHDRWKRRRVRERIAAGQKVEVIVAMSGGVSRDAIEFEMQNWREAR